MEKRIAPSYLRCFLPRYARILKLGTFGSNRGSFGDFRVEEGVVTGFSRSPVHPSASGGTL